MNKLNDLVATTPARDGGLAVMVRQSTETEWAQVGHVADDAAFDDFKAEHELSETEDYAAVDDLVEHYANPEKGWGDRAPVTDPNDVVGDEEGEGNDEGETDEVI